MPETDSQYAIAVAEQTCSKCGRTKPVGQFRYRDRISGVRHQECNACFVIYMQQYRSDKRKRELKAYVDQIATDTRPATSAGARSRTEALLEAMLKRFGGVEGFASDWFAFMRLAKLAGKHHVIQRSLEAVLRLLELADKGDQDRDRKEAARNRSDEDIHETMAIEVVQILWSEPAIAVVVLEHFGFTVEPPDDFPPQDSLGPVYDDVQQHIAGGLFGDGTAEACLSVQ